MCWKFHLNIFKAIYKVSLRLSAPVLTSISWEECREWIKMRCLSHVGRLELLNIVRRLIVGTQATPSVTLRWKCIHDIFHVSATQCSNCPYRDDPGIICYSCILLLVAFNLSCRVAPIWVNINGWSNTSQHSYTLSHALYSTVTPWGSPAHFGVQM